MEVQFKELFQVLIKATIYSDMPNDHSSLNFAKILYPYLKNWRIISKDGSVICTDLIADNLVESNYGKYYGDDKGCDKVSIPIKISSNVSDVKNNGQYIYVDLDIDENITTLRWDLDREHNPVQLGYICTFTLSSNQKIESFNYKKESRVEVHDDNPNNIYIYIEKQYFEQESFEMNPFFHRI